MPDSVYQNNVPNCFSDGQGFVIELENSIVSQRKQWPLDRRRFNWNVYTVWNNQDFSVNQILREINFGGFTSSKYAVFSNFWASEVLFWVTFSFSLQKLQKVTKIKIQSF